MSSVRRNEEKDFSAIEFETILDVTHDEAVITQKKVDELSQQLSSFMLAGDEKSAQERRDFEIAAEFSERDRIEQASRLKQEKLKKMEEDFVPATLQKISVEDLTPELIEECFCPLTAEPMWDAVVLPSGKTVSLRALKKHFEIKKTDPYSSLPLVSLEALAPNSLIENV